MGGVFCDINISHHLFFARLYFAFDDKKDPVYSVAHIVKYFPRAPNDLGKLDIVMTYTFSANNINYTKDNQTLNIDTTDLDNYYVGKEIPIVYYRVNPKYSKIDYYHASLKR
ncbi:hypothetical protein [Serratia sp. JUb9]|uniref:hypothetical protein n=1 Tax=Serratia sp. JUb9 TaxID=2724469 RepID=UPI0021071D10|nr:hypothetical protein [Serratia sp. JUb9]